MLLAGKSRDAAATQKCPHCYEYGLYEKACKNSAPEDSTQHQASTSKRGQGKSVKIVYVILKL
ncbi:hypothetical protein Hanom_Chr14g01262561 [Helianthus anomalus]